MNCEDNSEQENWSYCGKKKCESCGGDWMKCCEERKLEIILICECYDCGDIQEVQRKRKVCPFDKDCIFELNHYKRESCVNCDYSDYYCEDDY